LPKKSSKIHDVENPIIEYSIERNSVYIEKIILENFLSFERDEVIFKNSRTKKIPRFILVIGPNWSGKTSIFQAIRFGLGSNERDDRYKKWSDFIRTGQDHAMVEIHLRTEKNLIKIRRIVIRGRSPYFELKMPNDNNFRKVPAAKIQFLMEKLGYNPDNQFAFVSQGKIDIIKNLKPVELCSFLEEGIGLKGLRSEILMQKTRVSGLNKELHSLMSKQSFVDTSLKLLEPKLKRLEDKNKLLQEKKKLQDELLWANRSLLVKKIEELETKNVELKSEIKNVKLASEDLLRKIEEKETDIKQLEEKITHDSTKLGELTQEKKSLLNEINKWEEEKINVKNEIDKLKTEILGLQKDLKQVKEKKKAINQENNYIKNKKNDIKVKINDLNKESEELNKKIKENEQIYEFFKSLSERREILINKIKENESHLQTLTHDYEEIFESIDRIKHKLDKNEWFLEEPGEKLRLKLKEKIEECSNELYDLQITINNLQAENTRLINQYKRFSESLRNRRIILPHGISFLKEEIKKRRLSVKGPIIEYLKYDDELSYAIESILGEPLMYGFIASDWDSFNLLKRLKSSCNAYCNIYLPKKRPIVENLYPIKAPGVIDYLVNLIRIVDNDEDIKKVIFSKARNCLVIKERQNAKYVYSELGFNGRCVTLDGEQISSLKYVYETPHLKKLKGFLSIGTQKEQVENLEQRINDISQKIVSFKTKQKELDKEQRELIKKENSFDDLMFSFNKMQTLSQKKNELLKLQNDLYIENKKLNKEINELSRKIDSIKSKVDENFFDWTRRLQEIPLEKNELYEYLEKWNEKIEVNNERLEEVITNIKDLSGRIIVLKEKLDEKERLFKESNIKAFNIIKKLEDISNEIENITTRIQSLKKTKNTIENEKSKLEREKTLYDHDLMKFKETLEKIQDELLTSKQDLHRIDKEIGELVLKNVFELRPINQIEDDLKIIDKQLLEYLDVDDTLLIERDNLVKSLKEIEKYKDKIQKDINEAIKTESRLEDTYNKTFKTELNKLTSKINSKFNEAGIKVFCSLQLTGDFEQLGILIKAATSKKDLKECTALSGGQVSLVSIALILSLLEIKPSPLCLFDEPTMFLDDKNSELSYRMIKNTLEKQSIQLIMFLPRSINILYSLADKLIGVVRTDKKEVSMIIEPKIVKKED